MCKAKVAVCSEIHKKTLSPKRAPCRIFKVKPGGTLKKPLGFKRLSNSFQCCSNTIDINKYINPEDNNIWQLDPVFRNSSAQLKTSHGFKKVIFQNQSAHFLIPRSTTCLAPPSTKAPISYFLSTISARNKVKVKVKCTIVLALRLCTGRTAHRGSRGVAILFHDQR